MVRLAGRRLLLLAAALLVAACAGLDLYAVLGLPRSCSARDVKRAYRRLALELHPDKARDPPPHPHHT